MVSFDLPEPTWHELALEPETVTTKGAPSAPAERLEGWISLGQPVSVPVTLESVADDAELRQFLTAHRAEFKFYLVHLACTFRPAAGEKFANAWLEVKLAREDSTPEPLPIAWSMEPHRLEKAVEFSRTVKLGASLKLAGLVTGPEASVEEQKKWTDAEIFLEALNELQSDPVWEFTMTKSTEIRGLHRLAMVVRVPREAPAQGHVSLSASVQRKRLGLIPYRGTFPDAPYLTFRLV